MIKEFVPYELAVKLKALGFDEPCFGFFNKTWNKEKELLFPQYAGELENWNNTQHLCSAPTFSQAFRWFRGKYSDLDFGVAKIHNGTNNYHYHINLTWEFFEGTYEETELACLTKLIEIVEQQNQK